MKRTIIKRSVVLGKHKTSISLEEEFWKGLRTSRRPAAWLCPAYPCNSQMLSGQSLVRGPRVRIRPLLRAGTRDFRRSLQITRNELSAHGPEAKVL
jgi:hypothetical protein